MIQQMDWIWIDLFVRWGLGAGCLQNKTANHLISESEKCASSEKHLFHHRFYKENKNENKNLTVSLLRAHFGVFSRAKK